jgi:hypothetical protein
LTTTIVSLGKGSAHNLLFFRSCILLSTSYCVFLLADVWTVAYAFVPGGNLLRERSNTVLFVAAVTYLVSNMGRQRAVRRRKTMSFWTYLGCLWFVATVYTMMKMNVADNRATLVTIRDPNVLTVGIWTVHFGLDDHGYLSHRNMTDLIRKLDLDVVGLLESDTIRIIGGNRNLLTYMERKLNMYSIYGPRPNQNTWGCALLSKHPVENYTTHLLPSPVGELACAIHATLRMPSGLLVDVITSHNGQEEDYVDRLLQTKTIAGIAKQVTRPIFFIGYLVTEPGNNNPIYDIMVDDGNLTDIYPSDKWRWCEYIFYRDLYPLAYARVSHGKVTDTELQTAKFWVGGNDTTLHLNDGPDGNMYPSDLSGQEWNGHQYQVFSAPIYDPLNNRLRFI